MAALASNAPLVTRRAQRRLGIALVLPVTVMIVVFFLLPLGNALAYSVVDFDGVSPNPPFIGAANFVEMVTDPAVWHALSNNVIWIALGTAVPLVVGLLIALLLWGVQRGSMFYRLCFFLPYVLPGVAIGIVWGWIYDPVQGLLNESLGAIGLDSLQRRAGGRQPDRRSERRRAALVHHPAADHAGVSDGADPHPGRRVQRVRHHLHHDRRRPG
jgi:raffinose/stachyose/melibiose transport system permease protein